MARGRARRQRAEARRRGVVADAATVRCGVPHRSRDRDRRARRGLDVSDEIPIGDAVLGGRFVLWLRRKWAEGEDLETRFRRAGLADWETYVAQRIGELAERDEHVARAVERLETDRELF